MAADPAQTDLAIPALDADGASALLEAVADGAFVVDVVDQDAPRLAWASRRLVALLGPLEIPPVGGPVEFVRCHDTDCTFAEMAGRQPPEFRARVALGAREGELRPLADLTVRVVAGHPSRRLCTLALASDDWIVTAALDLPVPVAVYDRAMRLRWINPAGAAAVGLPREELVGRSWFELVPEAASRRDLFERAMSAGAGEIVQPAVPMTFPGQPTRWFRTRYRPVRNRAGEIDGLVGLAEEVTEQRAAEQALARERAQFKAITEHLIDVVNVVAPDGTIRLQCGSGGVSGRDPATRIGRSVYEHVHPEDAPRFREWMGALAASPPGTVADDLELRVRHASGNWHAIVVRGVNQLHVPGIEGLVQQVRDDSERRIAQAALRRTQETLRLAVQAARIGLFEYTFEPERFDASDEYYAMRRMDPVAARRRPLRAVWGDVHPEDLPAVRQRLDRVVAGETDWEIEYRLRTGDGDWLWVLQHGRVVEHAPDGRPVRLTGICVDIDRRKRAERGLAQSEARYRTLGAMTPGFMHESAAGPDGRLMIRWASEGLERLVGWTAEEFNARGGWSGLVHPADRPRAIASREPLSRGETAHCELRLLKRGGGTLWVSSYLYPLEDPDTGAVGGVLGVTYDVTHLKETEAALRESEERYRLVSELSPGFVFEAEVDVDGRVAVVWATGRGADTFGWTAADFGQDQWRPRHHPDDVPEVEARLARLLRGEETSGESRIYTATGEVRWARFRSRPVRDPVSGRINRIFGSIEDITERKLFEQQLRESEFRYRTVTELTSGFVYEARLEGERWRMSWVSPGFERVYGCSLERFEQEGLERFYEPDEIEGVRRRVRDARLGLDSRAEVRVRDVHGQRRWIAVSVRPLRSPGSGAYDRIVGAVEDITSRKLAEEALRIGELRYRTVAEAVPGFVYEAMLRDGEFRMTYASSGLERVYECDLETFNRLGWRHFQRFDDTAEQAPRIQRLLAGEVVIAERRILTAAGNVRWVRSIGRVLDPVSTPGEVRLVGVVEDVTPSREAAEALRDSEQRFRIATEAVQGIIYEIDLATQRTQHSRDLNEVLGLPPGTLPPENGAWLARVHPEDQVELAKAGYPLPPPGTIREFRYRVLHADGRWLDIWDRSIVVADGDGRPKRLIGWAVDVSRQAQTERLLADAEAIAHVGSWEFDVARGRLTWSDETYRIHGVDPERFQPTLDSALDFYTPQSRAAVETAVERAFGIGIGYDLEAEIVAGDGQRRWLRLIARSETSNGRVVRLYGACQDIDALKRAQERLQQQGDWLRMSIDAADMAVWRWYPDRDEAAVEYRGSAMASNTPEQPTLKGWMRQVVPEDRERVRAALEATARDGVPTDVEYRLRGADGDERWLVSRATRATDLETVVVTGSTQDITARKRASAALEASEATLRSIMENAPDFVVIVGPDLCIRFVNRALRGIPPAQVVGRPVADFAVGDLDTLVAALRRTFETGERLRLESASDAVDGTLRYYENRLGPIRTGGRIDGVIVHTTDVTDRRADERRLRTQASVLATMQEGVVVVDSRGTVRLTNPAFDRMYGYEPGALESRGVDELFGEATEFPEVGRRSAQFVGRRADGSLFEATAVGSRLVLAGEPFAVYVVQDVSERRALERELLEIANREQRRIGSDLHDGLGQELTGIALMLRGLASRVKRGQPTSPVELDELVALVNGAIESTRSLARGLSPVELERGGLVYALRALVAKAQERYGLKVRFRSAVRSRLVLDAAATTHLYRIAQEALTNAARHAQAQHVTVQLSVRGRSVALHVVDDGRGITDAAQDGMGLKIMRYRAGMMGGQLAIEPVEPSGTRIACRLLQPDPGAEGAA